MAAFAAALQQALEAKNLPLDRVCERLAARGIRLTPATLSYWQNDRTRPEQAKSLQAVAELEQILDLHHGALLSLLPPPRPRGAQRSSRQLADASSTIYGPSSWQQDLLGQSTPCLNDHVAFLSTTDDVYLDAGGRIKKLVITHVVQALRDNTTSSRHTHRLTPWTAQTPVRVTVSTGQLLEVRRHAATGGVLIDLGFGRPLRCGETDVIEYAVSFPPRGEPEQESYRRIVHGRDSYLLRVHFDHRKAPVSITSYRRDSADGPRANLRPCSLTPTGTTHTYYARCTPGIYGLLWSW